MLILLHGPEHLPLLLDPGLSRRETLDHMHQEHHLNSHHTQHRRPPGKCAQPTTVHTNDPRLPHQIWLRAYYQVCRRLDTGGPHRQWWWDTVRRRSGVAGTPVSRKPPISQRRQNERWKYQYWKAHAAYYPLLLLHVMSQEHKVS